MATYYDGPQLTGAAIDAHVFCQINETATPDTVIMCPNGTSSKLAFVSQVALAAGQALYGMQDSGYAIVKLASGQNPAADVAMTSTSSGQATAATTGKYIYGVTTEPASGAAGYVRIRLVESAILQPAP